MAKASVILTCAYCGETFTHSKICYNRSDADNYEEWAKGHIDTCPVCWRKQKEAEKMQEAEKAADGIELPTLNGSEKQIAWAEKIRAEKILEIKTNHISVKKLSALSEDQLETELEKLPPEKESVKKRYRDFWTMLHTDSAKWIIENR